MLSCSTTPEPHSWNETFFGDACMLDERPEAGIGIAGLVRKEVEDSGLVGHVASFREPTPPVATTSARWDDIRCRKQQGAPKH